MCNRLISDFYALIHNIVFAFGSSIGNRGEGWPMTEFARDVTPWPAVAPVSHLRPLPDIGGLPDTTDITSSPGFEYTTLLGTAENVRQP